MPSLTMTTTVANLLIKLKNGEHIVLFNHYRAKRHARYILCEFQPVFNWRNTAPNHGNLPEELVTLLLKNKLIEEVSEGVDLSLPYRKLWRLSDKGIRLNVPPRKYWVEEEA